MVIMFSDCCRWTLMYVFFFVFFLLSDWWWLYIVQDSISLQDKTWKLSNAYLRLALELAWAWSVPLVCDLKFRKIFGTWLNLSFRSFIRVPQTTCHEFRSFFECLFRFNSVGRLIILSFLSRRQLIMLKIVQWIDDTEKHLFYAYRYLWYQYRHHFSDDVFCLGWFHSRWARWRENPSSFRTGLKIFGSFFLSLKP